MTTVDLAQATQLFDLYCRSKGLAERTLETYRDALQGLGAFLEATGRTQEVPTIGDLRAYIARMLERGLSPTTVGIRMRSIRTFCNFLAREGIAERSPAGKLGMSKTAKVFPEALSREEVKAVLGVCTRRKGDCRREGG